MSIIERIMSFLGAKGTPIPTANTIEEGMVGALAPSWEPEELLPKEEREKIKIWQTKFLMNLQETPIQFTYH